MMNSVVIKLIFTDADPNETDPAVVGTTARNTIQALRSAGHEVEAAYTGEKGAAEVFLWLLAASATAGALIPPTDLALKVAQLLNEIKKLRGDGPRATVGDSQPIVIIIKTGGSTTTLRSDTAPSDAALLTNLLADQLPAQINPDSVIIEVQVPPTPPNEI
jgi:hypothetical protein